MFCYLLNANVCWISMSELRRRTGWGGRAGQNATLQLKFFSNANEVAFFIPHKILNSCSYSISHIISHKQKQTQGSNQIHTKITTLIRSHIWPIKAYRSQYNNRGFMIFIYIFTYMFTESNWPNMTTNKIQGWRHWNIHPRKNMYQENKRYTYPWGPTSLI
jgi:hypothetical protein